MIVESHRCFILAYTMMSSYINGAVGSIFEISTPHQRLGIMMTTMGQESALKVICKKLTSGLELAIYLRPIIGTFGLPLQLILLLAANFKHRLMNHC